MEGVFYFLKNKEFFLYFSITIVVCLMWIIYEIYRKLGLKKTTFIICSILLLLITYGKIKNFLVLKYPYNYLNYIYYHEEYPWNGKPSIEYILKYKYGKLSITRDGGVPQNSSYYEKKLNYEEKKELKQILKQFQILEWEERYDGNELETKTMEEKLGDDFECWGTVGNKGFYFNPESFPTNYFEFREKLWGFAIEKVKSEEEDIPEFNNIR